MKRTANLLVIAMSVVLGCAGCNRINLAGGGSSGGGLGDLLSMFGNQNGPPPVNGAWQITYVYKEKPFDTAVNFTQKGKTLSGDGKDDIGGFIVQNGTIEGTKVHFIKKYMDGDPGKAPVEYTGELTYENDPDYKGWTMGGHYKTTIENVPVEDKWVAVDSAAQAAAQQAGQQQQSQQPQQQQPQQAAQQPQDQGQQNGDTGNGGDDAQTLVPSVSGMYTASYDYAFKKIETRLWLKQVDGSNGVGGDGTDTNTGEYFTISKGIYNAPKLWLVCHYEKGKHASTTRDIAIKAVVTQGPRLDGETQFGSPWSAVAVQH